MTNKKIKGDRNGIFHEKRGTNYYQSLETPFMRKWTGEERKAQAQKIKEWQPWKKAGVKTQGGKASSRMNAMKHGAYSEEVKTIHRFFAHCRAQLIHCKLMLALSDKK